MIKSGITEVNSFLKNGYLTKGKKLQKIEFQLTNVIIIYQKIPITLLAQCANNGEKEIIDKK